MSKNNRVQIGIVIGLIAVILGLGLTTVNSYPPLEQTMGALLVDRRDREKSTAELQEKDYIFLYFSAKWCSPCRKFTPELVKFYREHAEDRNFEVVFVSSDRSRSDMNKYMKSYKMPWLAVPYSKYMHRTELRTTYGGRGGIPNLVLLNNKGKVLSSSYQRGKYVGPQKVLADFESY